MLFLSLLSMASLGAAATSYTHTNFTTVTGYFLQDDSATVASTFDYTATNFGLINRTYPADTKKSSKLTQWQRFHDQVAKLNDDAPSNIKYKVLFIGRHGEGYHNVAQTYYGDDAWNCYWSYQDGNATVTWADAHLTPNGIAQAQVANKFWASEIKNQKIKTPESFYVSPLYRCLDTARITFSGLDLPSNAQFVPTIKELAREGISGHTCDRRSNATFIHDSFPSYKFEGGFAEDDPLWSKTYSESNNGQDIRSKALLDDLFGHDDSVYISITSHSGETASILRVLGHRTFSLVTGAVIPVLVKYEVDAGQGALMAWQPWSAITSCTAPPAATATA